MGNKKRDRGSDFRPRPRLRLNSQPQGATKLQIFMLGALAFFMRVFLYALVSLAECVGWGRGQEILSRQVLKSTGELRMSCSTGRLAASGCTACNSTAELAYSLHQSPALKTGKKKERKLKLLGLDIFRWGVGLPPGGAGAQKFGMSLDTKGKQAFWVGYPGILAGISQVCPKSLRKNSLCSILDSITPPPFWRLKTLAASSLDRRASNL